MYTNIDGLVSSLRELRDYLHERKPEVACITETKLTREINVEFEEEGYNTWRRDRKNKGGGGVMILVRKNILIETVEYGEGRSETLSVEIKIQGQESRKIIVAYMPPKTNTWGTDDYKHMQSEFIKSIDDMLKIRNKVLLVGDFNSKEINWGEMEVTGIASTWSEEFLQTMMVNTMDQWVKENTRYRGEDEPSLLDLVFTKKPENEPSIEYLCPVGKSDHVKMEIEIKEEVPKFNEEYKNERKNYAKADFTGLKKFYGELDWNNLLRGMEVQKKYEVFLSKFREGVERYVPRYKVKENKKVWFNEKCAEAKKKKERAWKKMRKQWNEINREEYRTARNDYVKIRREEERNFERDLVGKCKEEPKLFYRYVNGKIKHRDTITKLKKNGEIYETTQEMAEILNKSFKSVFTRETVFASLGDEEQQKGIANIQVERKEIKRLLEELDTRKAMGPDEVNGWILKECREELEEPIWEIINSSLKEGKVPKEWKRANIVPLYKGGNKMEPLNYRPVSLTSIVSKLCEIVIKNRWVQYLEQENIITEKQFGFRKERSCITNLLSFYTRVIDKLQERDSWFDAVYLDLKKAFDTVPHKSLIWKLEHRGGLKGKILKWMKDYLQGREMSTVIRDNKSSWCEVTSGVPQGSVLAPIMFQVYINDMTVGLNSYINMFADDAKLMKVIKNQEDCEELQRDIDRIYEWSKRWKLEFNIKKCHVMEMGRSKRRPSWEYKMGGITIPKSKEEKDLGVIIQDTLSPEKHINGIFGSTYNLLANIRVAFNYLDKEMMKKIITHMIRPKLEYAAVVWSPHKKKDIRKLERIQRTATKMIPELEDLSYEERLEEIGLPTLQERRERGDLITMFKLVNGMEKIDRDDLVIKVEEGDRRTRGHMKKLKKSHCLGDIKKYSFPHRTVEIWNNLKEEVVAAKSVHMFKKKLDKFGYGDRTN